MFLAREEDINVKHEEVIASTIAGTKKNALLEATTAQDHSSNLGRVGGRRGSMIAANWPRLLTAICSWAPSPRRLPRASWVAKSGVGGTILSRSVL